MPNDEIENGSTVTASVTTPLDSLLNMATTQYYYTGNLTGAANVTIPTHNFSYSTLGTSFATGINSSSGLKVTGDAEFDGDVKIGGRSIKESLATIEKRLSILVPDPKKLEKYAALKKAYEHYKVMEAMCHDDDDT